MRRPKRTPSVCSAPGCSLQITRGRLMCRPHWFELPRILRETITSAWADRRIRDWSAACLQARAMLADRRAAGAGAPAGHVTPERAAELQRRLLGERDD